MKPRCLAGLLFLLVAIDSCLCAANVISFGAIGDGKADDTAAIQKAVDGGGGVRFPTGTFRLTRTVTINLSKTGFVALTSDGTTQVVMAGAGPAFQFIGTHEGTAAPDTIKPEVWARERTPRVDGLEIVGAHPEADGIAASGTMQISITHVTVRQVRHAIRLHGRNRNAMISDCHLYNNRGVGVFLDDVNLHQINITGSHISYNVQGGVVSRRGYIRNLQIGNCDIESNMAADGIPTANVLLDSTDGTTAEVAITGCTLQHNTTGPNSANIRIIGKGTAPAVGRRPAGPTNEGHITITGNVLSDVQTNVHLVGVRGATLTGNTFWMGFAYDLLVEDCSNIVVGPNNFDRNPRYESLNKVPNGGVVFRNSKDCTLTGMHVNAVRKHPAALQLEACTGFNLNGGSILQSDGIGLSMVNTSQTYVHGFVIRDSREKPNVAPSIKVTGGQSNTVIANVIDRPLSIEATSAIFRDNEVVASRQK